MKKKSEKVKEKINWKFSFKEIITIIVIVLFSGIIYFSGILKNAELNLSDKMFQAESSLDGNIVIIGIDTKSLNELGPFHTWNREYMANVIDELSGDFNKAPAAIGIDVMYFGNTNNADDHRLAKACENAGNVVVADFANFTSVLLNDENGNFYMNNNYISEFEEPYDELKKVTSQGHINIRNDVDGVIRNSLHYIQLDDGRKINSFAYQIYQIYAEYTGLPIDVNPIINRNNEWYIPYFAKSGGYYDGYSFSDVMNGKVPKEAFAGKVVLIGPYATGLLDNYVPAIDHNSQMYGVEIHANILDALIKQNFKSRLDKTFQGILFIIIILICAVLFDKLKLKYSTIIWLSVTFGYLGLSCLFYHFADVISDTLYIPLFVTIIYIIYVAMRYIWTLIEKKKVEEKMKILRTELNIAKKIQASTLPKKFDNFDIDIYASMKPAKEVGGDFYDIFNIDETHICVLIADVSGKGISAALFMLMAKATIKNYAQLRYSANEIFEKANNDLCENNDANMFVTAFMGILEKKSGKFTYVNAGHNPPVFLRKDSAFEWLPVKAGFVLAGMENMKYKPETINLEHGEAIFMYTDGVTEAQNKSEELFGENRLLEIFNDKDYKNKSVKESIEDIKEEIALFAGGAEQSDDITMVEFKY